MLDDLGLGTPEAGVAVDFPEQAKGGFLAGIHVFTQAVGLIGTKLEFGGDSKGFSFCHPERVEGSVQSQHPLGNETDPSTSLG